MILHCLLVVSRWKSGDLQVDFRHEFVFLHVGCDVESHGRAGSIDRPKGLLTSVLSSQKMRDHCM
jgi:hypothetical protein